MTIKLKSLAVQCDGECNPRSPKAGYCQHRCVTDTAGVLTDSGGIRVEMPHGWTQSEGRVFGPACTERRTLTKVLHAQVPDPDKDPPEVKKVRASQVELMREVIKEDLSGESDLEERVAPLREALHEPDFSMGVSGHINRIEVRVYSDVVDVRWPETQGSLFSITIRHEDLELVNPPPFIDQALVQWINGCLKTMKGDRLHKSAPTVN